jgi:hypothetical protein
MPDEVSDPMTDNGALNAIVDELELISGHLTGAYDTVSGSTNWTSLTDAKVLAREQEPLAIKTVITNRGPDPVKVYEDDILVLIVPPSESAPLPLNGSGEIKWECSTGNTAQAALATYKKTA